jgi:hypothetical protein
MNMCLTIGDEEDHCGIGVVYGGIPHGSITSLFFDHTPNIDVLENNGVTLLKP